MRMNWAALLPTRINWEQIVVEHVTQRSLWDIITIPPLDFFKHLFAQLDSLSMQLMFNATHVLSRARHVFLIAIAPLVMLQTTD